MKELKRNIELYSNDYLIMDGLIPSISLGQIQEEFRLYNIDESQYERILKCFVEITDKTVSEKYLISELSHGQKLILSALMVLNSSAQKILFHNFFTSISKKNREKIESIITIKSNEGKVIKIL
jgi:ABC-type uncharacterized transport system ATPase subunit